MSKSAFSRNRAPMGGRFGLDAVPGLVAGRPEVRRVRRLGGHADGMGDGAGLHLVVAHEPREDRQAGRVGRCPAGRAEGVRVEVPDRPRAGRRARRAVLRVVELVEGARRRVDHDGVAVARGLLPAFDGRVGTEGIGPGIALVGVLEGDGHQGLRRGHDGVGHAVGVGGSPEGPKSGWRFVVALSMLASHAALCGSTGRLAIGVFQTLSAGNIGQLGAPGTGVPADADVGRARRRQSQPHHRGRQEGGPVQRSCVVARAPPLVGTTVPDSAAGARHGAYAVGHAGAIAGVTTRTG